MSIRPIIEEIPAVHAPEAIVEALSAEPGVVLLRSGCLEPSQGRYSLVGARPFLIFRSFGSRCEIQAPATELAPGVRPVMPYARACVEFGNPWQVLEAWVSRYELLDEMDLPFPLGGCFGYWGYGLKNFIEPKLARRANDDLELPDCHLGFYDSLLVFDHHLARAWVISTGLEADGSRCERRQREGLEFWRAKVADLRPGGLPAGLCQHPLRDGKGRRRRAAFSNLSRAEFIARVERAQDYIRAGDIYQVNLSHRLTCPWAGTGWEFFRNLSAVSPAPFSAFLDGGDFQLASSSPELFLRLSGAAVQTRPIKGTRPRSRDSRRDAELARELWASSKERAELVMITDLLRNDLGRVCEFGSVRTPELMRLERYAQVQHLVSTVEGRLRPGLTHTAALAKCFPGGSVTGAPKFRAMEIIEELEPLARGPYTGALGYLGFNRESQLSIIIRTALCKEGQAHFQVGSGIVADSIPAAEYEETLAKGRGFLAAAQMGPPADAPRAENEPAHDCVA